MTENCGAMEKALQNPLILQEIFKNLNSSDLLDCRLVNNLNWLDLATEILCKKKTLKIDFNFSNWLSQENFSRAVGNPTENPWSLKSLIKCIKNSDFFPCFRFRFSQGYLDDQDLLDFFSTYGESIIELEIDLLARTNANNVIEKFGEILWKQLPNLEKLTIWEVSLGWSSSTRLFSRQFRPSAKLEKLKYFSFEKSVGNTSEFKFIQDIQTAAPNLQNQNVKEISFVPPKTEKASHLFTIWYSKGGIFPKLTFSPEKSNLGFYERLLRTKIKFSEIRINMEKVRRRPGLLSRVTGILTAILESSQSSLKALDGVMEIFSMPFPGIQLNLFKFPYVELLTLKTVTGVKTSPEEGKQDQDAENGLDLDSKPNRMCQISHSFPSLSTIHLDSLDLDFLKNFENSTVKILRIDKVFSFAAGFDFEKLAKIFPKLENLTLNNIQNFEESADSLWKNFGKVKKLEIGIVIENSNSDPDLDVSMDNAFLGMSSSILELEELKTLHLTFIPNPEKNAACKSGNDKKWERWNFLTKSTLKLLLEKMKQLKSIYFVVDATKTNVTDVDSIYKNLEDLMPFAHVRVRINDKSKRKRNKYPTRRRK